jgi:proteasome lid subunit RPN8/RPN11
VTDQPVEAIMLTRELADRLVTTVRERFPVKSFGYLLADSDARRPVDFVLFSENIRNDDEWQGDFHAYGRYFVEHDDAGFVATPDEAWRMQKEIWERDLFEVGVFHSHQRHPANFSEIDYDLHLSRFETLWHLIVSLRNPEIPQLRAFSVSRAGVSELPLLVTDHVGSSQ